MRSLVIAAALVIIIVGINQAQSVLVSFLVAVFFAIIGTPPVLWLERKRIPSVVAVLLVVAGMITILLIAGVIVGASINSFYTKLPVYQTRLQEQVSAFYAFLATKGIQGMRPKKNLRRIDRENCTWAVQAAIQNSACTIIRKMSVMRPTAAKELRHVNFKEYYFGFFQQHDYRFFYRL